MHIAPDNFWCNSLETLVERDIIYKLMYISFKIQEIFPESVAFAHVCLLDLQLSREIFPVF